MYIKLKIAIQGTKDVYIPTLSRFINNHCSFWKLTFDHQAKVTSEVRKSVYNIEMDFKQFFTWLETTSVFITYILRTTCRSSSPELFSKKGVLLQICSIFTIEHSCSHTFAWMFSRKLSKLFVEHLFWKTHLGDCF